MLSNNLSIIFYLLIIICSSYIFGMSQKYEVLHGKINYLLYVFGLLILVIPVAIRTCGVDYESYTSIYHNIADTGFTSYWNHYNESVIEPLYVLLNQFAATTRLGFRSVTILCAVLSIIPLYCGIFRIRNSVDLFTTTLYLGFMTYPLMFGLNRFCIALGIVSWSYQYFIDKKVWKFLICIAIATGFHYSAAFMIPVYLLINCLPKVPLKYYFLLVLLFSVCFLCVCKFGSKILVRFLPFWSRFSLYYIDTIQLSIFGEDAINIALWVFLIISLFINDFWTDFESILVKLSFTALSIMLCASVVQFHRLSYYFYPAEAMLYSLIGGKIKSGKLRVFNINPKTLYIIYFIGMLFMCLLWMYNFLIRRDYWAPFLVPYTFQ